MQDQNLTYTSIQPLLAATRQEGASLVCQFQAPGSHTVVEARATVRTTPRQNTLADSVKRNMLEGVKRMVYQGIRQLLGYGALAQTGSDLVNTVLTESNLKPAFSEADKQAAVLEAFQSVAGQFVYDNEKKEWSYRSDRSPYDLQLAQFPVSSPFEKEILARILVQLAAASQDINWKEEQFLMDVLGLSPLQFEEVRMKGPVSNLEAEAVSTGTKGTIFLLACTIALMDESLDQVERDHLDALKTNLGLDPAETDRLTLIAKNHILEGAITLAFSREQLLELAGQINMSETDAERAWIQYRKKNLK